MDDALSPGLQPRTILTLGLLLLATGVSWPHASRALVRNRCFLELEAPIEVPLDACRAAAGMQDPLLNFRLAMSQSDWAEARQFARGAFGPDRLAAGLVVGTVDRWLDQGQRDTSIAALDIAREVAGDDDLVWNALGSRYERAGRVDRAETCFRRGAVTDERRRWAEAYYDLALMYHRSQRWSDVITTLAPTLNGATDGEIRQRVHRPPGPAGDWQVACLLLGESYERVGDSVRAKQAYGRLLDMRPPDRDWMLNRALVSLAGLEMRDGALGSALSHTARALDLALGYPDRFRIEYETDTWKAVSRVIGYCQQGGWLNELEQEAAALVQATPESAGAWYARAAIGRATCRNRIAREALARARALTPPGAGSFAPGVLPGADRAARGLATCLEY